MIISKLSGKIHIDNNWSDAKSVGICSGFGTYSEPYIIEDLVIDGGEKGSCIWIENTDSHFKIQNCTVYNASYAGIYLYNTSNGQLNNNNCYNNSLIGISLNNCNNTLISGNIISCNFYKGPYLIYILGTNLQLLRTNNTLILNNSVNCNHNSIVLYESNYNIISNNFINCNINGTLIVGSYNKLYYNFFTRNDLHAIDTGLNNQWDNGTIGNYWDNYTGVDKDNDGIGDTPYNIPGSADSQDNFPIWDDGPESNPPTISGYKILFLIVIPTILVIIINKKEKKHLTRKR